MRLEESLTDDSVKVEPEDVFRYRKRRASLRIGLAGVAGFTATAGGVFAPQMTAALFWVRLAIIAMGICLLAYSGLSLYLGEHQIQRFRLTPTAFTPSRRPWPAGTPDALVGFGENENAETFSANDKEGILLTLQDGRAVPEMEYFGELAMAIGQWKDSGKGKGREEGKGKGERKGDISSN